MFVRKRRTTRGRRQSTVVPRQDMLTKRLKTDGEPQGTEDFNINDLTKEQRKTRRINTDEVVNSWDDKQQKHGVSSKANG